MNQKGVIRKLRGKIRFIYKEKTTFFKFVKVSDDLHEDMHFTDVTFYFFSKNYQRKNAGLYMEINGGDNNGVFLHDLRGDSFGVKPNELFMDINGGDKNGVFLHDLIKITEGTVSEGTIFMHIKFTIF